MTQIPKPTLVIYHADCLDGLGAAWAVFCKFGNAARYVAARFGEKFPRFDDGADIYIVDFSFPPDVLLEAASRAARVTLLDHHITAQTQCRDFFSQQPCPDNLMLHFDMSHSGCVLTWQHFFPEREVPQILLHIEDRDLWRFALPGSQAITTALHEQMPISLAAFGRQKLPKLLAVGGIQAKQFLKMAHRLAKYAHGVDLDGISGLAVNAPGFFASDLGHILAKKSGTFGMTYYYDGGKSLWFFALRSVGGFDVGSIAQRFGGGGHLNAAGFMLPCNPFTISEREQNVTLSMPMSISLP